MYRSMGELTAYAKQAFALFAAPAHTQPGCVSDDTDESNSTAATCGNAPDAASQQPCVLDRCGVECALYTLFGYCPPRSTVSVLFDAQHDNKDETNGVTTMARTVDEAAFLRFVAACGKHSGGDLVAQHDTHAHDNNSNSSSSSSSTWSAVTWRMYEALAGGKGYCTLDDLLAADTSAPFAALATQQQQQQQSSLFSFSLHQDASNELLAVLGNDKCDASLACVHADDGVDAQQRRALFAHVFDVLDRDGDGKVHYADLHPYLQA